MQLSARTAGYLASLIQTIAESEALLEGRRQQLAEQKLFDPISTYKRLDQDRTGSISLQNLVDFLVDNQVCATQNEVAQLFAWLDISGRGQLGQAEFTNFILSKEDLRSRQLASQRTTYSLRKNTLLPSEVEWALSNLFKQVIENKRQEKLAQADLQTCRDLNLGSLASTIDVDNLGYISMHNLIDFTRSQGIYVQTSDLERLYRIIDSDSDGRISYAQLLEWLLPLQVSQETQRRGSVDMKKQQHQDFLKQRMLAAIEDSLDTTAAFKKSEHVIQQLKQGRERVDREFDSKRQVREGGMKDSMVRSQKQSRIYHTPKKRNYQDTTNLKRSTPLKVHALHEYIVIYNDLEDIKKQLSLKTDFHPATAFALIDKLDRNQLNKLDFELACNGDLSIYPSKDQIFLLFQHYTPYSAFMNYKSFLPLMLPTSEEYQVIMLSRETGLRFSTQTRALFVSLINHHFSAESQSENIRQKLKKRPLFSTTQAFYAVDKQDQGFITIDQFQQMFEDYNISVSRKELEGLLRTFDRNYDGKVSYSEFIHQMSPKRA